MSHETTWCPRPRSSAINPAPTVPRPPVTSIRILILKIRVQAIHPTLDRIGLEHLCFRSDDSFNPPQITIRNHTSLRVVRGEAMIMFEVCCRFSIFLNLEIVNHDPRMLRLLA